MHVISWLKSLGAPTYENVSFSAVFIEFSAFLYLFYRCKTSYSAIFGSTKCFSAVRQRRVLYGRKKEKSLQNKYRLRHRTRLMARVNVKYFTMAQRKYLTKSFLWEIRHEFIKTNSSSKLCVLTVLTILTRLGALKPQH